MATLIFVHAHPDDEGTLTSGTMARAAAQGDQVHVVFATSGEHGEVPADLAPGETLADRRRAEAGESARRGGLAGVHWLGYTDSGMTGWSQNDEPDCLVQADLGEAAARVAAIVDDLHADILVGYDWHGNYGHPDHIRVHQITRRAAELSSVRPRLFEATMSRDRLRANFQAALAAGINPEEGFDPDQPADDGNPVGLPESELTLRVDVSEFLEVRRAMMGAHASQTQDAQAMLAMPPEVFAAMFSYEHFLEPGNPAPLRDGWF